jgi:hypothetical protein
MLAQVRSNDDGKQIVFSSMPAEADRQWDQLRGVLHELEATPATLCGGSGFLDSGIS